MNDFEKFLRKNKEQLELKEVNPDLWSGIEQGVQTKSKNRRIPLYRKLAGVAAILLVGFVLYQMSFSKSKHTIPDVLFADYGFENADVPKLLENKMNLIKGTAIPVNNKADLQLLLSQVNYLDQRYAAQVSYLKEKEYEEEIAKEVVKYYKIKSDLLDKVILEIQKINKNEKEYNVKSERTYMEI